MEAAGTPAATCVGHDGSQQTPSDASICLWHLSRASSGGSTLLIVSVVIAAVVAPGRRLVCPGRSNTRIQLARLDTFDTHIQTAQVASYS